MLSALNCECCPQQRCPCRLIINPKAGLMLKECDYPHVFSRSVYRSFTDIALEHPYHFHQRQHGVGEGGDVGAGGGDEIGVGVLLAPYFRQPLRLISAAFPVFIIVNSEQWGAIRY